MKDEIANGNITVQVLEVKGWSEARTNTSGSSETVSNREGGCESDGESAPDPIQDTPSSISSVSENTAKHSASKPVISEIVATRFPGLAFNPSETAIANLAKCTLDIDFPATSKSPEFATANILCAAWAILLSVYHDSIDVLFECTIPEEHGSTCRFPALVHLSEGVAISEFLQAIALQWTAGSRNSGGSAGVEFDHILEISPANDGKLVEEEANVSVSASGQHAARVQCVFNASKVLVIIHFDKNLLNIAQVEGLLETFSHTIQQLLSHESSALLSDLSTTSPKATQKILQANSTFPLAIEECVPNYFTAQSQLHPEKQAVHSWDGHLTYSELDSLSLKLACQLRSLGVGPNKLIPVAFEKSKWMIVAIMGVLRAGGAYVPLDPAHPRARLEFMLDDTDATLVLSSPTHAENPSFEGRKVFVVDEKISALPVPGREKTLQNIRPSDAAYAIFTSGTTGRAKGFLIEHRSYVTGAFARARSLHRDENARVLQFASYSFDPSVDDILLTLMTGGTIATPSEDERLNDIAGFMAKAEVNFANVTPGVANMIDPGRVPKLEVLVLSGDRMTKENIDTWSGPVKLINACKKFLLKIWGNTDRVEGGTSECSVKATLSKPMAKGDNINNIGHAISSNNLWIVNRNDHQMLVPIGAVGEILIEGPTVGRGYLHNDERTAAMFITSPTWLKVLRSDSRLYKTGDLGYLNGDGSLTLVGRKDTQIKIRGQRIELSEIEFHLRQNTTARVCVEAVKLRGQAADRLAAFIAVDVETGLDDESEMIAITDEARQLLMEAVNGLESRLANHLPSYMIPTTFIPVRRMPLTVNGKIDRRLLRNLASRLSSRILLGQSGETTEIQDPASENEKILVRLWMTTLKLDQDAVSVRDDFFGLGGDSLSAMKLAVSARVKGYLITVADVFNNPILTNMATKLVRLSDDNTIIQPFELVREMNEKNELLSEVDKFQDIQAETIEDIYPATPLQEGIMALTLKDPRMYISQFIYKLGHSVSMERYRTAWEEVTRRSPILRTRIVHLKDVESTMQLVLREDIKWREWNSLDSYLRMDKDEAMLEGDALARHGVVHDSQSGGFVHVFTVHHSIYDGRSRRLILEQVQRAYYSLPMLAPDEFNLFIKYRESINNQSSKNFWTQKLDNAPPPMFPFQASSRQLFADVKATRICEFPKPVAGVTLGTVITTAWALLVARYSESASEVVFGVVRNGGNSGIEPNGPTMATVPVRVQLKKTDSLADIFRKVQDDYAESMPFEHYGLQNIQKLSDSARVACGFHNILVIQQEVSDWEDDADKDGLRLLSGDDDQALNYAISMNVTPTEDGVFLLANYDARVIDSLQIQRILNQYAHLLRQMGGRTVHDLKKISIQHLDLISPEDVEEIHAWNRRLAIPEPLQLCLQDFFLGQCAKIPEEIALSGWDGDFTYRELYNTSSQLARHLMHLGIGTGLSEFVPLAFEHSKWMVVAQLAVLMTGAAIVPIDPRNPIERTQKVLENIGAEHVLSSPSLSPTFEGIVKSIICLDSSLMASLPQQASTELPKVSPESIAVVIHTSGSTGTPKGILITHKTLCTSFMTHFKAMSIRPRSRVLQYSSYTFDHSLYEIHITFLGGSCVCIPSEESRANELIQVMRDMKITLAYMTPSVAKLLSPKELPDLEILYLGGEAISQSLIDTWTADEKRLVAGYGPTECSMCTYLEYHSGSVGSTIGKSQGGICWVVDADDTDRLAPIGTIGELIFEGPMLAMGYLNNPAATEKSFIKAPAWVRDFDPIGYQRRRYYKSGDLVRHSTDGSFLYHGRKDTQIKIRGQRVEIGEVEHQLQLLLPGDVEFAVEVVSFADGEGTPSLAAIISILNEESPATSGGRYAQGLLRLKQLTIGLEESLLKVLPEYMVPTFFIPLHSRLPLNSSGKVDRMLLRRIASKLSLSEIASFTAPEVYQAPSTAMEKSLRNLWASTLRIGDSSIIGAGSSFFRLGGDSITSMKLVAAARGAGISITVKKIFDNPVLADMAREGRYVSADPHAELQPFELLKPELIDSIREAACQRCDLTPEMIEDIFPCTPLQEGLMALTMKNPGTYVSQLRFELPKDLDIACFQGAWNAVAQTCCRMLRTRIFDASTRRLMQVVVKESLDWKMSNCLEDYLKADQNAPIEVGLPLSRFAIVEEEEGSKKHFVWTTHHATNDDWSRERLLAEVEKIYYGGTPTTQCYFNSFIKNVVNIDQSASKDFWTKQLLDAPIPSFPALPHLGYKPTPNASFVHPISTLGRAQHGSDIALPTRVRAAWSLLVSTYSESEDIIFGVTNNGRAADVPHIEAIMAPTIATIPIRMKVPKSQHVSRWLANIQHQSSTMIEHEQFGLQYIQQINEVTRAACEFQSLFLVQIETERKTFLRAKQFEESSSEAFHSFALGLECHINGTTITVYAEFDSNVMTDLEVQRLVYQFEHILRQLWYDQPDLRVGDIDLVSPNDLQVIDNWNSVRPTTKATCLHHIFQQRAVERPQSIAVSAWDGELSYGQLDTLSNQLAIHIVSMNLGVGAEVRVLLCFEKSLYTIISLLAVLKAGGVCVLLDASQPKERHEMIRRISGAPLTLLSLEQSRVIKDSESPSLVVDKAFFESLSPLNTAKLCDSVVPSNAAFVVFTSGSTGEPKGIIVEHQAAVSSVTAIGEFIDFDTNTRMLQFSGYAFDACYGEIFTTLLYGGVLCVLSDHDRNNNLVGAINSFRVDRVFFPPTVVSYMKPEDVPMLKILACGGEQMTEGVIREWSDKVRLFNSYGPAEATIMCCAKRDLQRNDHTGDIGRGNGASLIWIVDRDDHNKLAPLGTSGEVLIEGPTLARGYLNDEVKTKSAYIEDPAWISSYDWATSTDSLPRRFYKSGDMAQYNPDGSLQIIGRQDTQLKIRGQRVELGEIEVQLRRYLGMEVDVVVEGIKPAKGSGVAVVAFIAFDSEAVSANKNTQSEIMSSEDAKQKLMNMVMGIDSRLATVLPIYMIPSAYLPITRIPQTNTLKTDRKKLRQLASALSIKELNSFSAVLSAKREPATDMERTLRSIWMEVLHLSADQVSADDSFFRIGGDSISAMKVVSAARAAHVQLRVDQIFAHPILSDLALVAQMADGTLISLIEPFSIVDSANGNIEYLKEQAKVQCDIDPQRIEDIYPCSPLQTALVALSAKVSGLYVANFVFKLPESLNLAMYKEAWDAVVRKTPILRTRFFQTSTKMMQAVLTGENDWNHGDNLQAFLRRDKSSPMSFGKSSSRFAIVQGALGSGERYLVLTLHRAVYDAQSLGNLFSTVNKAYLQKPLLDEPQTGYNAFIKHLEGQDELSSKAYWQSQMADAPRMSFPALPTISYQPAASSKHSLDILIQQNRQSGFTMSTFIRAAWALILARYADDVDDVVFGATLSGRTAGFPGVEAIVGPTTAVVPVRVRLNKESQTVHDLLHSIQAQATEMMTGSLEQWGLRNIRNLSDDIRAACDFQTLLMVDQSSDDQSAVDDLGITEVDPEISGAFHTYALSLDCRISTDRVRVRLEFDSNILSSRQMQRLLGQFEHVLRQLSGPQSNDKKLCDVEIISEADIAELIRWNFDVDESTDVCVHHLFEQRAIIQPGNEAICAWDGSMTYKQLNDLSTRLGFYLRSFGIGPNFLVPLLFEKSIWTVVTMLAVLKAGGACAALDPKHPGERLKGLVEDLGSSLVLASRPCARKAKGMADKVIIIDGTIMHTIEAWKASEDQVVPPQPADTEAKPHNPAFILFTSGSTGKPKGIIIEHRNLSSSINGHAHILRYGGPGSRNLQFTAYTSDVSIGEIFTSLAVGACVCIPSDAERMNGLAEAMERMRVNWAFLTPSVASLLHPSEVPSLKTLLFGGETATVQNIDTWAPAVYLINSFGPAECSIWTHCNPGISVGDSGNNIGFGISCNTWITDPTDRNKLAPIGTIGELIVEGPNVAAGYLNNPEKTRAAFIGPPTWVAKHVRRPVSNFYAMGDLVRYLPDGKLHYFGRRDHQIKLRGQRIELGEIEHQLRRTMPGFTEVAVEMVRPVGGTASPMLVGFISVALEVNYSKTSEFLPEVATSELELARYNQAMETVHAELPALLPSHMIPSAFIPLRMMPFTASAKTDRNKLQRLAKSFTLEEIANSSLRIQHHAIEPPLTETEKLLHGFWSQVLNISPDSFGRDDHFFRVSGDSIMAMRLVAIVRSANLDLTVESIFMYPILSAMALATTPLQINDKVIQPYELIDDITTLRHEASLACNISEGDIEDIYPVTALQEGLLLLAQKEHGSYTAQFSFELPHDIDMDRLRAAWETAYQQIPILRTRLFHSTHHGTMQAVTRGPLRWRSGLNKERYLAEDRNAGMRMGEPLSRIAIVEYRILCFTAHHAIYDGWSVQMIFRRVEDIYHGNSTKPLVHFNKFIKYVTSIDQAAAEYFWRDQLANVPPPIFPKKIVSRNHEFQEGYLSHDVAFSKRTGTDFTGATLIRTALALLLARYSDINDVVYGATNSGRAAPVQDIYDIAGPTLATAPVRVSFSPNTRIADLLKSVQQQSLEITHYEQFGLQNISHLSADAKIACDFRTLLVIQNPEDDENDAIGTFMGCPTAQKRFFKAFHTYPLVFQCTFNKQGYRLDLVYDEAVIPPKQAQRLAQHFSHLVHQLNLEHESKEVQDLNMFTEGDYEDIRSFNRDLTEPLNTCLHELIENVAAGCPNSIAIHSWDGDFTYAELDRLSCLVANKLLSLGVTIGSIIPICFEKSKWTVVAMLGILKAGAAYCPLDSNHPAVRVREIITEVKTQILLASASHMGLFSNYGIDIMEISEMALEQFSHDIGATAVRHIEVSSRHPAYCLFTSGSSGKPKGVITSHGAISTSVTQHGFFGLHKDSRVLQFSAYTFDISVVEIFSTLVHAGCVCKPSENQRLDGLVQAMNDMRVTLAILTPSFAKLVSPEQLPCLEELILGAEPIRKDLIEAWAGKVRLLNAYGVTEASVCNMICEVDAPDFSEQTIGTALGSRSWIVDSEDHNKLVPVGLVGELAIEGPILSDGYLNDHTKTAAAFVEDASFFEAFAELGAGSGKRRLYKTGDLVRYKLNGLIDFIGRKDTQIKLHGFRIELGEIEHQVRTALQGNPDVVAEVVTPGGRTDNPAIAIFLRYSDEGDEVDSNVAEASILQAITPALRARISSLDSDLQFALPSYMIPTLCYFLKSMPLLSSGKIDRRSLRKIAQEEESEITLQDLSILSELEPVSTEKEIALQMLWAAVLSIEPATIGNNSSFFRLGGDSLIAVKLVSAARKQSIGLRVATIFNHPKLSDMASQMSINSDERMIAVPPLSLVDAKDVGSLLQEAARQCNIPMHDIEDMYPTTPLQEGMMVASLQDAGTYNMHFAYRLSPSMDLVKFKQAWTQVISRCSIMRTRIIHTAASGFMQIITQKGIEITEIDNTDVERYKQEQLSDLMDLGKPLYRLAILSEKDESNSSSYLVLTTHHAAYDGWSIMNLWRNVQEAYHDTIQSPILGINHLISYLRRQSVEENLSFWKGYLDGSAPPSFPPLPKVGYRSVADSELNTTIRFSKLSSSDTTLASVLQAAWGLLVSLYEGSRSVTFGLVVSGRTTPVPGIENMVGSAIANFPFRVTYDPNETVQQYLENIKQNSTEIIPYQQFGFQNIRKASPDAKAATALRTLLVFQAGGFSSLDLNLGLGIEPLPVSVAGLYTFPITVTCTQNIEDISVNVSYDSEVIGSAQIQILMKQFEHLVDQLGNLPSVSPRIKINEINLINAMDMDTIHSWHVRDNVKSNERTLHTMVHDQASIRPSAPAVCSWDGEITYGELDEYSDRLAQRLMVLGIVPEDFVTFAFEKSVYSIVAIVAILKAGAVWAPLNPDHPEIRLQYLIGRLASKVLLTTPSLSLLFESSLENILLINKEFLDNLPALASNFQLPIITADNAAYIMFTSGSTGVPKGVVVQHRAACSALPAQAIVQHKDANSRYLQFASFTWDFCVGEIFANLISGGCVCMPSDHDRLNDLAGAMKRLRINQASLTPTVASLLRPEDVELKTLSLGGEALTQELVNTWAPRLNLINVYGPTECTVWCSGRSALQFGTSAANIGTGLNCSMWIADSENYDRLMPIGTVGEILVDGPVLARGYLHDPETTARVFIESPAWALGANKTPRRLYVTGDMGVYDPDGSIRILGRRDAQVKLNGQRLDLGEIDFQLHRVLGANYPPATEAIKLRGRDRLHLVVFIAIPVPESQDYNGVKASAQILESEEIRTKLIGIIAGVEKELVQVLPEFMIPHLYIPINYIPTSANLKIDHKALHALCEDLTLEQLGSLGVAPGLGEMVEPTTNVGMKLRGLWAEVLEINLSTISSRDTFSALGGDSMAAVKLVSLARAAGLRLTVGKILSHQVLEKMAEVVELITEEDTAAIPPFSLVDSEKIEQIKQEVVRKCAMEDDCIEDIYPATSQQIGYIKASVKYPGATTLLTAFELMDTVDLGRLKSAWQFTVASHAILRTRIVEGREGEWVQVVEKDYLVQWRKASSMQEYFGQEINDPTGPGTVLNRAGFVIDSTSGKRYFITTACHSTYDAWSYALLFATLEYAYMEKTPRITEVSNNRFIKYLETIDSIAQDGFWRSQLDAFQAPKPLFETPSGKVEANTICDYEVHLQQQSPRRDIAMPTAIYASWALALYQLTGASDVTILLTLSGRNAPVAEIERMIGPVLTTIPLRVRIDPSKSASILLSNIESQCRIMIAHEQCSIDRIRTLSPSAQAACDSAFGLTVNPYNHHKANIGTGIGLLRPLRLPLGLSPSPFYLDCAISEYGVDAFAMFDDRVVDRDIVQMLFAQFESNIRHFTQGSGEDLVEDLAIGTQLVKDTEKFRMVSIGPGLGYDPVNKMTIDVMTDFEKGGALEKGFDALDEGKTAQRGVVKNEHGQFLAL